MLKKRGKLLKYEFRFYFRILPPFYLILALIALFAGFQMKQPEVKFFLVFIWVALIVAIMVVNTVLIVQRFIDNFLKNPGYLMFTLPVTAWALVASKAIAALCTVLMSVLALAISGFVYALGASDIHSVVELINELIPQWGNGIIHFWENAANYSGFLFSLLIFLVTILQQICLIYALITASRILPRFRFVAGVAMYFAVMRFVHQPVFGLLERYSEYFPGVLLYQITHCVTAFAFAALFLYATGFLLKSRLNLE